MTAQEPARLATFNLKYGRDPEVVAGEVDRLMRKHELTAVAVQEAREYLEQLDALPGTLVAGVQTAVLVAAGHKVTHAGSEDHGDGWHTQDGAKHRPGEFTRCTIDGWLRFASTHWPTPSSWPHGVLEAPAERKDDLTALALRCRRFLSYDDELTRAIGADFNEGPGTRGKLAPRWVAETTGSQLRTGTGRQGHGRIDGFLVKRGRVVRIGKDLQLAEGSDHEPVVAWIARRH